MAFEGASEFEAVGRDIHSDGSIELCYRLTALVWPFVDVVC